MSPSVTQWTLVDHGMGLLAIPHYILGAYSGGIRMLWSEGCMSTLAVGMELLKESKKGVACHLSGLQQPVPLMCIGHRGAAELLPQ